MWRLMDQARHARTEPGFGWLDGDGGLDAGKGLPLIITARMTHVFSLGVLLGRRGDEEYVDHGVSALLGAFRDGEHDGWFSHLDAGGAPTSWNKTAYEHAFVLLAASSATLAGRPAAADLLNAAIAVVDAHFWDEQAGAFVEDWDRSWTTLSDYRGANANMHGLEACLAVAAATADRAWLDRALRVAARFVDTGARGRGWRLPEHYDATWAVLPDYNVDNPADPFRPYGVTPGHGMEWARLLLHLHAELDGDQPAPAWLKESAVALFDRSVADGWDSRRGGFVYTTSWDGTPVVTNRFHWVLAEAIGAASALRQATGEDRYAELEAIFWDYAQRVFIGPTRIGWIHEVDEDGVPATGTWSGRPDFYHAVQATLVPRLPLAPAMAAALAGHIDLR